MKKICICLLCVVLFAKVASAQKELLAFNEVNKYIYYQVVDQPGVTADTLQARAFDFLKTLSPKVSAKQDSSINGTGKFLVVSGITMVKHQDGEIHYTFVIECKNYKYRYWLTGFVFTPYKTDRYGNSVPVPGMDVSLESVEAKLSKKQSDNYVSQAGFFSKQFGDKLKQYMLNSAAAAKEVKKKVVTKDW